MFIDSILAGVILDWTFINNLIDNDDGKTIFEEKQISETAEVSPEIYYQTQTTYKMWFIW